ncbi:MAG: hypothetical protein WBC05_00780, partial [Sedimentisphaerales bacterium]
MKNRLRHPKWQILLYILVVLVWISGLAQAGEVTVSSRITHEVLNGFYIDKGTDHGLRQGLTGSLQFDDGQVLDFEVVQATRKLAMLRFAGPSDKQERLVGQAVQLVFERDSPDVENKDRESPAKSSVTANNDMFVPLLAPPQW